MSIRPVQDTVDVIRASDNNNVVAYFSNSAVEVLVPAGLPTTFRTKLLQVGTGVVTLTAGSGAVLGSESGSLATAGQSGEISLTGYRANEFIVAGNGGGGGGGGAGHYIVALSVTDLTALNSVPVATGIPAPGAGKKLVFAYGFLQYVQGASSFESSVGVQIVYDGDTTAIGTAIIQGSTPGEENINIISLTNGFSTPGFSVANKSFTLLGTSDAGVFGPISSLAVSSGQGGTGYANGDLFNVISVGTGAIGIVTGNTAGVVTSVAITGGGTDPGESYTTDTDNSTSVITGGGDGALAVDITVSTPTTGHAQVDLWVETVDALT